MKQKKIYKSFFFWAVVIFIGSSAALISLYATSSDLYEFQTKLGKGEIKSVSFLDLGLHKGKLVWKERDRWITRDYDIKNAKEEKILEKTQEIETKDNHTPWETILFGIFFSLTIVFGILTLVHIFLAIFDKNPYRGTSYYEEICAISSKNEK